MAAKLPGDPKGYYHVLGLDPGSDGAAVKTAFRQLAMALHPDRNNSPDAHEKFHAITAAYKILSNPEKKAQYDALSRNTDTAEKQQTQYKRQASAGTGARDKQKSERTDPRPSANQARQEKPQDQRRKRTWSTSSPPPLLPLSTCDRCGRVAAQPRYVIFPLVRGTLVRSLHSSIEGLYCRRCADITGLQVSIRNWLLGWWSLSGAVDTIHALWVTARGGILPADRNYRALMHQARAFLARQDRDMAHNIARQARQFATTVGQQYMADSLVPASPQSAARQLKDRWSGVGAFRLLQLSPLYLAGAVTAVVSWNTIRDAETPLVGPDKDKPGNTDSVSPSSPSLKAGGLHETMAAGLAIRSGPGTGFQKTGELAAGAMVLVTETDTGGNWARIITPEGMSGYVPSRFLNPVHIPRQERTTGTQRE
ncbi:MULTISPECIES: DnaJ domain-containing protein [unclassified Haematospirillum]|uniref:DnaJ domain-containing protein n=1 Tax=unclassified Haematospirillum TaxID=2622088 RepID=UPI0014389194|nr:MULTISPECIES: DnaJ domain-containing protein [unclassified Haematospirillum]NKD54469.1 DnaJ domain-containing protein [Haematospirillum sp. H4890]NKD74512.1 DnaJ domain-containing protein [Haematospirillum sp. H4485]